MKYLRSQLWLASFTIPHSVVCSLSMPNLRRPNDYEGDRALQSRIINGTFVEEKDIYPWFTSLLRTNESLPDDIYYEYYTSDLINTCGGMLVAPDIVLSAAHCTNGQNVVRVRVGALKYPYDDNGGQYMEEIDVEEIFEHPTYDVDSYLDNDFVVLKLAETSSISPVKMDGYEKISEQYTGKRT